jgi:hypothetical protein
MKNVARERARETARDKKEKEEELFQEAHQQAMKKAISEHKDALTSGKCAPFYAVEKAGLENIDPGTVLFWLNPEKYDSANEAEKYSHELLAQYIIASRALRDMRMHAGTGEFKETFGERSLT